jgi:hypothetical protein
MDQASHRFEPISSRIRPTTPGWAASALVGLTVVCSAGCLSVDHDDGRISTASPSSPAAINCSARPTAPPTCLGLDPFYQKYVWAGIPIVGSAKVRDEAFEVACDTVSHMLELRPDITRQLRAFNVRVGIMAADETTTVMPEHADLNTAFPDTNWDERARGLGATVERPLSSAAEENLLALANDRYRGENILVHEFAHTMWTVGVAQLPGSDMERRLGAAFAAANSAGTYVDTYAQTNKDEYWAEGVQSWFDTNLQAIPANGIHNQINTRAELIAADPDLAAILRDVYREDAWHPKPY